VTTRSDYLSAQKLEEGTVVWTQNCTVVNRASSENRVRVIPASKVSKEVISTAAGWCKWESKNYPQQPPNSGKFHWNYNEHYEERIYVESGSAIVTPDDGSPAVSFGKGDFVTFLRGVTCLWQVKEPVVKRFCFFNEKGEIIGGGEIRCDFCSRECSSKSYTVFPGELDLCPQCFQARGKRYVSAKRLEKGIVAEEIRVQKEAVSTKMSELITVTRATKVSDDLKKDAAGWKRWFSEDHPQEPPTSGKFHYEYTEHYEERILVESGRATVRPDDGSPAISFGPGDFVTFTRGLSCIWEVQKPIIKRYCFFDEDGKKVDGGGVICDFCEGDCSSRSMVISPGEIDVCPKCFKTMETYDSVKILEQGVEVGVLNSAKKRSRRRKRKIAVLDQGGAPWLPVRDLQAKKKVRHNKLCKKIHVCDICRAKTTTRTYPTNAGNIILCKKCSNAARRNSKCTLVTAKEVEVEPRRDMNKLIVLVQSGEVPEELKEKASGWSRWDSRTHPQKPPNSGRFHYEYLAYEEQILVISGRATIFPDDGSSAVSFGAGDFVRFRQGLSCT